MKILIIRNYPTYFDVVNNTYNIQEIGLAKALVRKGHKCDIIFWTDKEEKTIEYVFDSNKHIIIYYKKGINLLKNAVYPELDDLIRKYDIIQPAEYNQLQSWILANKYPDKTVVFHGPYYSLFNKRYNKLCKLMDLLVLPVYKKKNTQFIVKSRLAKKFLLSKGINNERIAVNGVGIDLDALYNQNKNIPEILRPVIECKADIKLLYVGKLEARRNILFLFNVLKNIIDKQCDVKLIIIGTGDKKYKKKCFDYAEKNGILDKIIHIEKLEQKYLSYVYKVSDVFLLPTFYEIFGMVLLEAMFFCNIVITTTNGGSDMLIESETNGIIIDEFDPEQWSEAIINNYHNDRMKNLASEKIIQKFTWEALADNFIEVYKKLKQ